LLTLPAAHEPFVSGLAFSPDGRRLVTVGGSPFGSRPTSRVKVWTALGEDPGHCLRDWPHTAWVRDVVYGPDGRRVAWTGSDGTITAADVDKGAVVRTRKLPPGFQRAILSADAGRYASFNATGRVCVWDLESGKEVLSVRAVDTSPDNLALSPDGRHFAVQAGDTLRVWDVAPPREVHVLSQATEGRSRPAFSSDSRLLALGTSRGLVRIWDVASGQVIQSLSGHAGGVLAVAFSPVGPQLATAGADHTVRLWNIQNGSELLRLHGHQGRASCLSFHLSGRYLASGSEQPGDVKVWDLTRPQEYTPVARDSSGRGSVEALGFGSDTLQVVRSGGWLEQVRPDTGTLIGASQMGLVSKWLVPASLAAWSADGRQLAAVSREDGRIVQVRDTAREEPRCRLEHPYPVSRVVFSRDGRRLATVACDWEKKESPREIGVWDAATGQRLTTVSCDGLRPQYLCGVVALSPDGQLLAYDEYGLSPGDRGSAERAGRVRIQDVATGQVRQTLDGFRSAILALAFSPDGHTLALASEKENLIVFDCQAQQWLHPQALDGSTVEMLWDLAFSTDGRRLAAASRTRVRVWDVTTGQMLLVLSGAPPRPGDNGFNPRVTWSADGRLLAANNWDGSVSIWDAADRQQAVAKRVLYESAEERARRP
jgi:WD40 repeat protein